MGKYKIMYNGPHPDFSKIQFIAFDFDGVFTDNAVYTDQQGQEMVRCDRSDGIGLTRLSAIDISSVVISTESNPVVQVRCEKLNIPCYHGVSDKLNKLKQVLEKYKISPKHTAFVGNDINDLTALNYVGFPITVADAYPEIKEMACWRTTKPGGYGAVREICDKIVNSREDN